MTLSFSMESVSQSGRCLYERERDIVYDVAFNSMEKNS
jgi:hypothetical protein